MLPRSWLASLATAMFLNALSGLGFFSIAVAQVRLSEADPNWTEGQVPPPPAYSKSKLMDLDIARPGEMKYGFDPSAMSVGKDFVTRYVMVAYTNAGGYNATYEGLRCATGEVKIYARQFAPDGPWSPIKEPEWQSLYAPRFKYAMELALQGVCDGSSNRRTVNEIVQEIKKPQKLNTR